MSDEQSHGGDDPGHGQRDPTWPPPTTPPPDAGNQPTSPEATPRADSTTAWYRRRWAPSAIAAVLAFLLGIGAGASGADPEGAQDELAALTSEVSELEDQVEEYEAEIAELEEQLSAASAEADAAPEVSDLEQQLEETEAELADAERRAETAEELEARAAELDEREERLASQQETASSEEAAESGCSSGQVDINSAGSADLQSIHQIGPERAEQIVSLRPFSSVDGLTRVSGIGPAHLDAIKDQGLACVP